MSSARVCVYSLFFLLFFSLYTSFTHNAHRVTGVRIKPPSHEANMKALLGRETRTCVNCIPESYSGMQLTQVTRCRRQCIEVCSVDQSAQSVVNFFTFIFQLSGWALVHGTFVLCTASSRCMRIAGPGAAMRFFLAQISLTNVIRTYT